jgi:galactitol-specific phosphotransferase system IIC component
MIGPGNKDLEEGRTMFLFILLPALLVLGMVLIAGPALLPFALIAAVAFVVTRMVVRHRHPDQSLHPH